MIPYTTLRELRQEGACIDRYKHLKKCLGKCGDDDPIALVEILEHNGLDDVLWIPRSIVHGDNVSKRYRLFAVACCHNILHLMNDQRSRDAVKAAHLFAYGEISNEELDAAWDAAGPVAGSVAGSVALAAARSVAWDAAGPVAWDAARAKQTEQFKIIFGADFSGSFEATGGRVE